MHIVLLVEDDPLIADLYGSVLELGKFKTSKITDPTQVFSFVQENKPDLIVLDLMMPRLSGMEVLEKLKSDDTTKDIPVVMFSNLLDSDSQKEAIEKGAVRYAVKSDYPPRAFIGLVNEVLGVSQAPEGA